MEKLITPPDQIITLQEAKDHLVVSGNAEDALITGYIMTAMKWVQNRMQKPVGVQTWGMFFDNFSQAFGINKPPILSVVVKYIDKIGNIQVVDPASYYVFSGGVVFNSDFVFPDVSDKKESVIVEATVGEVTDFMKGMVKIFVALLYASRDMNNVKESTMRTMEEIIKTEAEWL